MVMYFHSYTDVKIALSQACKQTLDKLDISIVTEYLICIKKLGELSWMVLCLVTS